MDSVLIEVGIGLALLYLLLSLSVTSVNEVIESLFELRGKELRKKVREIFSCDADKILNDPLIASLSKRKLPSYIPSRLFGEAVAKQLDDVMEGAADLRAQLEQGTISLNDYKEGLEKVVNSSKFRSHSYALRILERAEGSGIEFVKSVEDRATQHFEDMMERVSGLFVRRVKLNSAIIAIVLVVAANADTMRVFNRLSVDESLRSALVESAETFSEISEDPGAYSETGELDFNVNDVVLERAAATFPLGWECPDNGNSIGWPNLACIWDGGEIATLESISKILFGWAITVLAIMLGAPFWFGVLQRITNIRAVGEKPKAVVSEK